MSYQKTPITDELNKEVQELISFGWEINLKALTLKIVTKHESGLNEVNGPEIYWRTCGYHYTRKELRDILNDIKHEEEKPKTQLTLFGREYQFIHSYYDVEIDGEKVFIPIEKMTVKQVREKAQFHIKLGRANIEHGHELLDYADRLEMNEKAA